MKGYTNVPMSLDDVAKVIKAHNLSGNTAASLGLFLSGQVTSQAAAAKKVGVHYTLVSHALARITETAKCKCCGAPVKTIRLEK